jgi:predicted permease
MDDWRGEIVKRLAGLNLPPAREAEIVEEVAQHLEDRYQELVAGGATEEEARRVVVEELSDASADGLARGLRRVEQEVTQEPVVPGGQGGSHFLAGIWQDIRYGARMLARNPGFTAVAVITLALGIGLNTVIFSMVNGLLLRPLPVRHPEQIDTLSAQTKPRGFGNVFSYQDFQEIRKQTSVLFSDMAGVGPSSVTGLSVSGSSERMWTDFVTGNFFNLLGIRPALGRLILPSEGHIAGADAVLVLGYSFWKVRFGGDPNIVGKKASVNGRLVTIVGVAPEGFHSISSFLDTQGYMPLGMAVVDSQTKSDFLNDRREKNLILVARVKPGVSAKETQTTLDVIAKRLAAGYPKTDDWVTLNAFPLPTTGPTSDPNPDPTLVVVSALFLSLASVVLIVACVNVTNLLLARASVRRGEIAIRAALGATRSRLVWHLLTESLLLALFGCVVGIVVALAGNRALSSLPFHTDFPLVLDFHFDWRVFAYAFATAFLAGAVAGIAPALRTTGGNLNEALHGSGRTTTASGHRFRSGLVVSQVGGSLMLLIVAGLFVRSLLNVQRADLGFDPHHVLNIAVDPHLAGYSQSQAYEFLEGLLERVRALPGVKSASLAATVPMGGYNMGGSLEIDHLGSSPGEKAPSAGYNIVSPGYFETMHIPLLRGRDIRETDDQNSMRVAVINQAMAERFWRGRDPIGKEFRLKEDLSQPLEVVGVVKNTTTSDLSGDLYLPARPYFYMALAQKRMLPVTLQVRTAGEPERMAQGIIGLVKSLEPAMPLADALTMIEAVGGPNGLLLFRLGAGLAGVIGILGLILATIGVYGVVSYMATQRTHEIGIRLALGALPTEILGMVLRQGVFVIAFGTVLGISAAFAIARLVGNFLIGVTATDPLTYAGVALMLGLVALAACYFPAWRATKVDPMTALRYE